MLIFCSNVKLKDQLGCENVEMFIQVSASDLKGGIIGEAKILK